MTTDTTAVLFIIVKEIATMNFHNYVRYSLILAMVTDRYVYLINAGDGLITNCDQGDNRYRLSIYPGTFSYLATVYVCPGKAR